MIRTVLAAAAAAGLVASGAGAKDLCIELEVYFPGAVIVLKGAKLGPGAFGPVHGYLAEYDAGSFSDFFPVDGQALVSQQRNLVVGLAFHETALQPAGELNVLNDLSAINLGCVPGADGKLGSGDACEATVFDIAGDAHVIACKDAPKLP